MKRRIAKKVIRGQYYGGQDYRGSTLQIAAGEYSRHKQRLHRSFVGLRSGTHVLFKNKVGIYRGTILGSLADGDAYRVRILSGPDMVGWVVDLPKGFITKTSRRRRR